MKFNFPLFYLILLLLGSCSNIDIVENTTKPNIIIIMVDDMGFSDISSYGSEISTPNIDKLADNGLKFTQFYNAGRCCPSRASLLSGLYAHKTGLGYMTARDYGKPGYRADLNNECVTIAEVLKEANYNTYMAGKWHLSFNFKEDESKHNWPLQRGFDKFFGTLLGVGSYWNPITLAEGNSYIEATDNFYYTEAITDKSIEYISNHNPDKPFFLYMAYTAPHFPLHAREESISKYRGKFSDGWDKLRERRYKRLIDSGIIDDSWALPERDEKNIPWENSSDREWEQSRMEAYAGTIDHVDQGIGKLMTSLKEQGALDNTIIFFLSDNGGEKIEHLDGKIGSSGLPWSLMKYVPIRTKKGEIIMSGDFPGIKLGPENTYGGYGLKWANLSNTPFRKFKTYMHEGGISSPLIVHWPNGIKAKSELRKQPAHIIDIMATCIDLAATKYPEKYNNQTIKKIDGRSLIPMIQSDSKIRDSLFWEHQGNKAVRVGKWKLVSILENKSWELYDMENDRTETNNLATRYPEKVIALEQVYNTWASKSNVVPWEEMEISVIPIGKNPYSRTMEEANEAYNEIQEYVKSMTN